ncbi:alpha/beta hydrolase fold protein [Salinarchaeum sp. Harcht-Bsk1]|uniref:alpha/beta fold hydrolase n=1 Tax=Salinarchaeum sp. Harcht-Bsk1 TaxID=1333523 RepID=UPI0003423190|nr:alpha/beta fold hydrolase [Salinarchaeum sp. Harcht-Bsk1]AGN02877.1 alpha/beta hydrolase fold protein [Salinarchaeum sp. Harcht-Bsk1]
MPDWVSTFGAKSDRTVVLLHPAGWTRHAWTPHAERLADRYCVVTIDLPGHGVHPAPEFSMERAVADVDRVLDSFGTAALVGHSLGGYVAIRAAAGDPERVDGLLLAGAAYNWYWRSPVGLALSVAQRLQSSLFEGLSHFPRLARRFKHVPDDETQLPPPHEDTHPYWTGFVSAIRDITFRQSWQDVEAYGGPTLIIHGDTELLAGQAGALAARAKANLRWIEGDHYAPMDDAETFTAEVARFLDDVYAVQMEASASENRSHRVRDLLRVGG